MQTITASELQRDVPGVLDLLKTGAPILITRDNGQAVAVLEPVEPERTEANLPEPPPWSEIMAEVWKARDEIKDSERTPNYVLEERKRRRR